MFKSNKLDRCNIIVVLVAMEVMLKEEKTKNGEISHPFLNVVFKRGEQRGECERFEYKPLKDDNDEDLKANMAVYDRINKMIKNQAHFSDEASTRSNSDQSGRQTKIGSMFNRKALENGSFVTLDPERGRKYKIYDMSKTLNDPTLLTRNSQFPYKEINGEKVY